ncbi:recombination regulator RecX [Cytobacillus depressus]|uniref:Regulatory protein RecX n=1 Tax=Cytobacillus depressus TaxID=1602942 RepID=A0A6L3UX65_9BACI|nr:recombination regulator RecX [Cytobacillus depressus]KAB2328531.1 recombination regulator RecX [Cytobacillus depressus]
MPTITKISMQEKRTDRYNVFLDDKYAFSVDEDVLIKHQLKKGMELDEFSISEIAYQDDIRKSYNTAIQFLSRRMRSEKEVRKHLADKDVDEIVIREVIHKLYEYRFLDDQEFAVAFVRTLMNTTDKGSEVIRGELREKGIAENLIDIAMKEYPYENEFAAALKLCEKFVQKNTRDSSRVMKQKLEQLLYRKGYPLEIIQAAIAETEMEKEVDVEIAALRTYAEKAHRKFSSLNGFEYEQKMKQTLYRKGFSMELIEDVIAELKET